MVCLWFEGHQVLSDASRLGETGGIDVPLVPPEGTNIAGTLILDF